MANVKQNWQLGFHLSSERSSLGKQDALVGMRTHGVVTGVRDYGVFVTFYNGMHGLVPNNETGLDPSQETTTSFQIGQVRLLTFLTSL